MEGHVLYPTSTNKGASTMSMQYTNTYAPDLSAAGLRSNREFLQKRLREVEEEAHAIRTALTSIKQHPNLHEGFVPAAQQALQRAEAALKQAEEVTEELKAA